MKSLKIVVLAALLSFAAQVSHAQTNHIRTVSIEFTVKSQGASTTNKSGTVTESITTTRLGSSDLVKALGTDTSLATNGFPAGSYLALDTVTTVDSTNAEIFVVVSGKGANEVITPVNADITTSVPSTALKAGRFSTNGTASATEYRFRDVTISIPNSWNLALSGIATHNVLDVTQGRGKSAITVDAGDVFWNLSGYGTEGASATPVLVAGTLQAGRSSVSY